MTLNRRIFLKQLGLGVAGFGLVESLPAASWIHRAAQLPRSLPETQGVAASGILDLINAINAGKMNIHSLMVLRHGKVVAEGWWAPYAPDLRHTLYSLSKSFTSTAIGLAVAEGRLKVDDQVISFFPNELPAQPSPNLAAMQVKDLLRMGTGHGKDCLLSASFTPPDQSWVKSILSQPVDYTPGTHFLYNNGASYLLSALVQKVTGQTLLAYLKPRLFDPLQITGADWETNAEGINTGGWGLRVKTEDIAKFGQLYLQKGVWNGKRILPEAWIEEATGQQIQNATGIDKAKDQTNQWAQGYGYQFWRCRGGAFRGDGAYGQFCLVLPREDAVIAMTAETDNMQGLLEAVWKHLLPALQGTGRTADPTLQSSLPQQLSSLALAHPAGPHSSPTAARVHQKTFSMTDNVLGIRRVTLSFQKNRCLFTLHDDRGEHRVACGLGRWLDGKTRLSTIPLKLVPTSGPGEKEEKIAASGAWSDEQTFVMHWRFIETAHYQSVTCRFEGEQLRLELKKSLAILNPASKDPRPILTGRIQS